MNKEWQEILDLAATLKTFSIEGYPKPFDAETEQAFREITTDELNEKVNSRDFFLSVAEKIIDLKKS